MVLLQITVADLEQRGLTQEYIDKIKPIGVVTAAVQFETTSGTFSGMKQFRDFRGTHICGIIYHINFRP